MTVGTRDAVRLPGLLVEPRRPNGTVLIWVHGLGSSFANGQPLARALSRRLTAAGAAYFKCDTRGHHVMAYAGARLAGAACERFEECIHDVRAMVAFARRAGYQRVVLAGHSTGANKVLYYLSRGRPRGVAGVILLGPIADIAGETKRIGARELARRVAVAARLARRDPDALVPRAYGVWSARRYLSLYRAGGVEDVFPYYRSDARWTALGRVRVPMAVVVGARDEYLDRPAASLIDALARHAVRSASFTGVMIPGAGHSFRGHEGTLARAVIAWIDTL